MQREEDASNETLDILVGLAFAGVGGGVWLMQFVRDVDGAFWAAIASGFLMGPLIAWILSRTVSLRKSNAPDRSANGGAIGLVGGALGIALARSSNAAAFLIGALSYWLGLSVMLIAMYLGWVRRKNRQRALGLD